MTKIKIGIIGTGIMAKIYSKIISQRTDCELICVTGNSEINSKRFGKEFGIKFNYNSEYDKMMVQNPDLNAIIITTPEWVRIEPVKSAIKYKKHILLEKPFAKSKEDAEYLYSLLKHYDKVFEICHVLRYSPRFQALKYSIDQGKIGEIRHIYARRNSNNVRVQRVLGKTDLAYWLTPHDIDIMRWITQSEIIEVYAISRNQLNSIDDYLTINLKFENNVNAVLQISWCTPPLSPTARDTVFEVWGNKGYLEVEDYNMNIKLFTENDNVTSLDTYEDYKINGIHRGYFENLIDNFIRKIKGNQNSGNSLLDALESIRICDMISNSINKNRIVSKI
jgi:predicted dehydrogenase